MEEKTGKIQRTTQSSSTISSHDNDTSPSDHIPLDLTIEILSRLPAKSVVRFRSVSNLWSAITTSQDFISSFASRSLASRPSVLLTVKKSNMLLVFSSRLHKNSSDGPLSCLGSYRFPKLKLHHYRYVHGLIFLEGSNQLVVWNPTVKCFFTLPAPEGTEWENGWIVGYDSIEGKYIVLFVLLRDSKICILTLGAQGQRSCTIITNSFPKHRPTITPCGRCIDGVMYYRAAVSVAVRCEHFIMSFDVRSKKFNKITYPEGYSLVSCYVNCDMVRYEGRLAIVETTKFPSIDLWILKNGDRHEWTHKRFVLPLSELMDPMRSQEFFYGVTDAGELIFGQGWLSQSFNVLYFDPRRKSISRQVSFDVGDEDRCGYGLDKDSRYNMNIYPNHIESLVSLL